MKESESTWHFLTNHAHVVLCISEDPDVTVRTLSHRIGITERAVMRIISELVEDGYLERTKEGRRNHYTLLVDRPLRHELESHCSVGDLVAILRSGERTVAHS